MLLLFSSPLSSFPQANSSVTIWEIFLQCSGFATNLFSCTSLGMIWSDECAVHSQDQALVCSSPITSSPSFCTLLASTVEPPVAND